MAIQKIPVEHFLSLAKNHPVIDVRSPAEFLHAHIPGACSLPLFDDAERKVVGTTYKRQSRQSAIKIGLDYFGQKMRPMVEKVEEIIANSRLQCNADGSSGEQPATVLVHCWRGGMRSMAVAWLLDLYGFKVYTLAGGYKAFRNCVLQQFDKSYHLKILGGYTGSGKTILINELKRNGQAVVNLEELANHKGSAFGALGEKKQPSSEMFENLLALELLKAFQGNVSLALSPLWLEDESQRIGALNIPNSFWQKMRNSPVYFLEIPFEERLRYLIETYGKFTKEELTAAILRLQKKLGGLETRNAVNFLTEDNFSECFSILLNYYDKCYTKGLHSRSNLAGMLKRISCKTVSIDNVAHLALVEI